MSAQHQWAIQDGFDARFDWGPSGVLRLAPHVNCLAMVDVLRFTTTVETGVSVGLEVYPYKFKDESAKQFADSKAAIYASGSFGSPSLSPETLLKLEPGSSVVLPSPNGSACSLLAARYCANIVAGCLRNAAAVGAWLQNSRPPVGVIACGEVGQDGTLRPSLEDLLGAGAILSQVSFGRSPEAESAVAVFQAAVSQLDQTLAGCASGRELAERGMMQDVQWASQLNVSDAVPVLVDGAFRRSRITYSR